MHLKEPSSLNFKPLALELALNGRRTLSHGPNSDLTTAKKKALLSGRPRIQTSQATEAFHMVPARRVGSRHAGSCYRGPGV